MRRLWKRIPEGGYLNTWLYAHWMSWTIDRVFKIDISNMLVRDYQLYTRAEHISNPWIISLSWGIKSQKTRATSSISGRHENHQRKERKKAET